MAAAGVGIDSNQNSMVLDLAQAGDKYTFRFQPDGKELSREHRLDSLESDSGPAERKLPYAGQYYQSDQLLHTSQKTAYNTIDTGALDRVSDERIKSNLR